MNYGYIHAMQAAGVVVLNYREFWGIEEHADWLARVYIDGEVRYVRGVVGLSDWDDFDREFEWIEDEDTDYEALAEFGRRYLPGACDLDGALAAARDDEARAWLRMVSAIPCRPML